MAIYTLSGAVNLSGSTSEPDILETVTLTIVTRTNTDMFTQTAGVAQITDWSNVQSLTIDLGNGTVYDLDDVINTPDTYIYIDLAQWGETSETVAFDVVIDGNWISIPLDGDPIDNSGSWYDYFTSNDFGPVTSGPFTEDTPFTWADADGVSIIPGYHGTEDNDTITGSNDADTIYGMGGSDTISGLGGDDYIYAGNEQTTDGNDYVYGGSGDDHIFGGFATDYVYGNSGNDTFYFIGVDYVDNIDGGGNFDTIDMSGFTFSGATIDLLGGTYSTVQNGATITSVENVIGTNMDDTIIATSRDNDIYGGEGNDTIAANGGDDSISVSGGNNVINAGRDSDEVYAGDGDDIIRAGHGNDYIYGGDGRNRLSGNDGDDYMVAGEDRDNLYGGAGVDVMFGRSGNDRLFGGDGDDILLAGPGNDVMGGGAGADVFYLTLGDGSARILDFDTTEDTILFYDAVSGFDDLSIRQVRNDTIINFGDDGDRIVLKRVDADTLTEDQFIFEFF